jgi:hypothetical protein
MQLTNILRDVGEDARRGRCYLPDDASPAFGLSSADVLATRPSAPTSAGAVHGLHGRPRRGALRGRRPRASRSSPPTRGAAPAACATGYAGILGAIERAGYDTVTRRAPPRPGRAGAVLWQAWRWREPAPGDVCAGPGPRLYWDAVAAGAAADAAAPAERAARRRRLAPTAAPTCCRAPSPTASASPDSAAHDAPHRPVRRRPRRRPRHARGRDARPRRRGVPRVPRRTLDLLGGRLRHLPERRAAGVAAGAGQPARASRSAGPFGPATDRGPGRARRRAPRRRPARRARAR